MPKTTADLIIIATVIWATVLFLLDLTDPAIMMTNFAILYQLFRMEPRR